VLTNVSLGIVLDAKPEEGPVINRVYLGARSTVRGRAAVVVGRYKKPGTAKVTISGRSARRSRSSTSGHAGRPQQGRFERLHREALAVRRVGEILDELD